MAANYLIVTGSPTTAVAATLTPDAVPIPIVIPSPTITAVINFTPDPVTIPVVIPTPAIAAVVTLIPDAVPIPVVIPAPAILAVVGFTPNAVPIPVVVPTPALSAVIALTPDPVPILIVIPSPTVAAIVTLTPNPVAIPIIIPSPTLAPGAVTFVPNPVTIVIVIPIPTIFQPVIGGLDFLFQQAMITLLKADTDLTSALPDGPEGIREEYWRGTAFQYPCIRVSRPTFSPYGRGACTPDQAYVAFRIMAHSKLDSTRNAQKLQGLVTAALQGKQLSTADLRTTGIYASALDPVRPAGEVWRGNVNFETIMTAK